MLAAEVGKLRARRFVVARALARAWQRQLALTRWLVGRLLSHPHRLPVWAPKFCCHTNSRNSRVARSKPRRPHLSDSRRQTSKLGKMGHPAGLRAGTRYAFSRNFREKGMIRLSTYLQQYKYVCVRGSGRCAIEGRQLTKLQGWRHRRYQGQRCRSEGVSDKSNMVLLLQGRGSAVFGLVEGSLRARP